MARRRPTPKEVYEAYLTLFMPEIRNAFLSTMQNVVDNVMLTDLVTSIENSDLERALKVLGMSPGALRPITSVIERAYEQGGVLTGKTFPEYLNTPSGRVIFHFDVRNSRAEAWLRERSSSMISRIEDEARLNIQNTLTDGVARGVNPRTTALNIVGRIDRSSGKRTGGVIGLTNQQEGWARSIRTRLENLDKSYFTMSLRDKRFDSVVQKAIDKGEPLPRETVERLVTRYKDKALKFRGDTVARTESAQAFNASEYEAVEQAIDLGAIRENEVEREWDDVGDVRTRHTHILMSGQTVKMREAFVSPSGSRMMYPGDRSLGADASEIVGCRCRAKLKIDWFGRFRND